MIEIIDGYKYDTENAIKLGEGEWNGVKDHYHTKETLYQDSNGRYFLHGEGGPGSCYRRELEMNFYSSGEAILLYTEEEAKEWAQRVLSSEEYERIFDLRTITDNTTVELSLPPEIFKKLKELSVASNLSVSELIEEWVKEKA